MSCVCTPYCPPPTGNTLIGNGVITLNGLDGIVTLVASGGLIIGVSGQNIVITNPAGASGVWDPFMYVPGTYASSQQLLAYNPARYCMLPAGLIGSKANCDTAPTLSVACILAKNGSTIGTINFSGGSVVGTFSFTNNIIFDPDTFGGIGDKLTVVTPVGIDATFAGMRVSFKGIRVT